MNVMASQITGISNVSSTICSGAPHRNHQAPRHCPLWGNPPVICGFPSQRASNAEKVPSDDVIMFVTKVMSSQNSASLTFVRGLHRWPVNCLLKGPVTRKCFHLMTSSCVTGDTSIRHPDLVQIVSAHRFIPNGASACTVMTKCFAYPDDIT